MLAALLTFPSAQAQDKMTESRTSLAEPYCPFRLNQSISSSKSQPGQIITARIMQDVPLANGGKIREGSKVIGHVVSVSSPAEGDGGKLSLQFDKLISFRPNNSHQNQSEGGCGIHGDHASRNTHRRSRIHADCEKRRWVATSPTPRQGDVTTTEGEVGRKIRETVAY